MFGAKRFTQISREVTGISDKVLARELRELETNLMVTRTVHTGFPSNVEYCITSHGESVHSIMVELKNWGKKVNVLTYISNRIYIEY